MITCHWVVYMFIILMQLLWSPVYKVRLPFRKVCVNLFTRFTYLSKPNYQIFSWKKKSKKSVSTFVTFFLIIFTPRITTARFRHIDLFTEFLDKTNALFSSFWQLDGCILCPELLRKWLLVGHTRLNVFLDFFLNSRMW